MFSIKPRIRQDWFIVFEDAPRKRWHHRWLKEGFRHCYVMFKSDAGLFWLIINPHQSHTEVDYRLIDTFPVVTDYTGPISTVIEYTAIIDPMQKCTQLGILTCVDVIKRHLGIRAHLVFTPYQLFKYLRRRNERLIQDGQIGC